MSSQGNQAAETLAKQPFQLPTIGGKYFALVVLFSMNLLNYVDRYSFFAAGETDQAPDALNIDDYWFGWLGASFMIVYTIVSPLMGWLGDRYNRKVLLAGGVGSGAWRRSGTAFSADYCHMFFWRASGHRRGELWRDRPDAPVRFVSGQRARPRNGALLPGACRWERPWATSWAVRSLTCWDGGRCFSLSACRGCWRLSEGSCFWTRAAEPRKAAPRASKAGRPRMTGLSGFLPHADVPVQHGRDGGRDVCDRGLRGLGLDLLSARSRPHGASRRAIRSVGCWSSRA